MVSLCIYHLLLHAELREGCSLWDCRIKTYLLNWFIYLISMSFWASWMLPESRDTSEMAIARRFCGTNYASSFGKSSGVWQCRSGCPYTSVRSREVQSQQQHLTLETVQSTWWAPPTMGCCGDSPKEAHSSSQGNAGIPLSSVLCGAGRLWS